MFTDAQESGPDVGMKHYKIVTIIVCNFSKSIFMRRKEITLTVIFIFQQAPFVMKRDQNGSNTGNDQFYGYCIDLLKDIVNFTQPPFTYEIFEVEDGKFGNIEDGKWNGMIGALKDKVSE